MGVALSNHMRRGDVLPESSPAGGIASGRHYMDDGVDLIVAFCSKSALHSAEPLPSVGTVLRKAYI